MSELMPYGNGNQSSCWFQHLKTYTGISKGARLLILNDTGCMSVCGEDVKSEVLLLVATCLLMLSAMLSVIAPRMACVFKGHEIFREQQNMLSHT